MKRITCIDHRIKPKNIQDLINLPVIIRVNEFNEESATKFAEEMDKAHNTEQPIIPIVIDSYGGQVYSLLSMIAEINAAKVPVATICLGKAMSCGSVLLTCGTPGYRYIDPNSYVMIHDVSSMAWGKHEELKASVAQTDKLQKQIFRLMGENCGKEADYFTKILHEKAHAEWYLTANEAKKHGLVNHIKVPNFKISLSLNIEIE